MPEEKNIPYVAFESVQIRHERTVKRLVIALTIAVILIFASNAIWIYAWCQYDYSSEQSVSVQQDTKDGGNANFIGANGDITNGSSKSSNNKNENTP